MSVYIALLHYPVYNKRGKVVTTTITNLDIHDISRLAKTYNIDRYYIVNPLKSQRLMAKRIIDHWQRGYGLTYNYTRHEAFTVTELALDLGEVVDKIKDRERQEPVIVATDAKPYPNNIGYKDLREKILKGDLPYLILFGTGWGIEESLLKKSDYILSPITGRGDYNHLSVRSAVSIIIDRLLGEDFSR